MPDLIPQISVIVPVYNVEKYLPRCIESVLSQTFSNFELLLIDDGSTDRSGNICDRYAQNDSRIRVYHQNNQGVSTARNLGIEHARCEWLCLIDSDDYLDRDYLAVFMTQGHLTEDCLNLQGWQCVNEKEETVKTIQYPFLFSELPQAGETIANYQAFSNNAPWAKLFNRNLIKRHQLCFPTQLPVREDAVFSYNYRMHIKSIQLLPASSYHYRLPRKRITLSHSNHKPEVFLYVREVLPDLIKKVCQRFGLQGSKYEQQNISYFKNSTDLSILKSIYAYALPRAERLKTLQLVLGDPAIDPAFRIKTSLKMFKTAYRLLSAAGMDLFLYPPFRLYYKYIKKNQLASRNNVFL